MQHVELVELQQVDHPPDLLDGEERAGHVEGQAAPGVPRRVEDPRARHPDLARRRRAGGRGRGHQLDQRGQAARDAGRFRRAQQDPTVLDHQRVALVGRVAAARREAGRRGKPARFARGGQLDRDGRFSRCRRRVPAPGAGPCAGRSARRIARRGRDRRIGVRDHRARPEGEPGPVPGVEPRRSWYDRVVHRRFRRRPAPASTAHRRGQRGHRRVGRDLGGQRVGVRPVDVAQGDAVVGDLGVVAGGLELAGSLPPGPGCRSRSLPRSSRSTSRFATGSVLGGEKPTQPSPPVMSRGEAADHRAAFWVGSAACADCSG